MFYSLDPTGNNHGETELHEVAIEPEKDTAAAEESSGFKVKERSILQAKLTKLAIQIGYAGKVNRKKHNMRNLVYKFIHDFIEICRDIFKSFFLYHKL